MENKPVKRSIKDFLIDHVVGVFAVGALILLVVVTALIFLNMDLAQNMNTPMP